MAKKIKAEYGNDSISALKGADRVRRRPGVIFGSDGLEGCEHAFFEILSNSIDEAREGYGDVITVTRFLDRSIQVEDFGRGMDEGENPVFLFLPGDYSGSLLLVFENGKAAKVDAAAFETKSNRRRLTGAYSDKSPLTAVFHLTGDDELALYSQSRLLLVSTAMSLTAASSSPSPPSAAR